MWYVALRMEITYGKCVSFLFIILTYFLFRHNYVICLFDVATIFDDVRITLYFGTFELRMEMTWKLRFVFVRHCDFFLFHYNYVIYLFVVVVTFFDDIRNRYYFATFELRMKITLQLCFIGSNVNEVIRTILNFFFTKRFYTHNKHKKHISEQK